MRDYPPPRQIGRVDTETWSIWRAAARLARETWTTFASRAIWARVRSVLGLTQEEEPMEENHDC